MIPIPVRESLTDPLLYRVVDRMHPLLEEEIKSTIEPELLSLPLTMDGILVANEHVRVHSLCKKDLAELFTDSNNAQTGLYVHSGFRSYEEQAIAYSQAKDKSTVLLPGTSQHHTGLALDFTSSEIGKLVDINSGFEQTKAAKWLVDHAWEYGFPAQLYKQPRRHSQRILALPVRRQRGGEIVPASLNLPAGTGMCSSCKPPSGWAWTGLCLMGSPEGRGGDPRIEIGDQRTDIRYPISHPRSPFPDIRSPILPQTAFHQENPDDCHAEMNNIRSNTPV